MRQGDTAPGQAGAIPIRNHDRNHIWEVTVLVWHEEALGAVIEQSTPLSACKGATAKVRVCRASGDSTCACVLGEVESKSRGRPREVLSPETTGEGSLADD